GLSLQTAPVPMRPPPTDLGEEFAGPARNLLRLPTYVSVGKDRGHLHWCFVGSPERLSTDAIKRLLDRPAFRLIPVQLAARSTAPPGSLDPGTHLYRRRGAYPVAGVLDLARVGPSLSERYRGRRADLLRFTNPEAVEDEAKRRECTARQQ